MKLLFDQNISYRVIPRINDIFSGSTHVTMVGLEDSTDFEIWQYASKNDFCIVRLIVLPGCIEPAALVVPVGLIEFYLLIQFTDLSAKRIQIINVALLNGISFHPVKTPPDKGGAL